MLYLWGQGSCNAICLTVISSVFALGIVLGVGTVSKVGRVLGLWKLLGE